MFKIESIIKALLNQAPQKKTFSMNNEADCYTNQENIKCYLKAVSEADLLEGYNWHENMNIIGILEERNKMRIRRPKFEKYNKCLHTVLKVAREVAANECATSDILIAYRLPGRNTRSRHVIAGFSQKLAKVNFFAIKKGLNKSEIIKSVNLFENLAAPRLLFFILKN